MECRSVPTGLSWWLLGDDETDSCRSMSGDGCLCFVRNREVPRRLAGPATRDGRRADPSAVNERVRELGRIVVDRGLV